MIILAIVLVLGTVYLYRQLQPSVPTHLANGGSLNGTAAGANGKSGTATGAANGFADTGRDFVAAMKQNVRRLPPRISIARCPATSGFGSVATDAWNLGLTVRRRTRRLSSFTVLRLVRQRTIRHVSPKRQRVDSDCLRSSSILKSLFIPFCGSHYERADCVHETATTLTTSTKFPTIAWSSFVWLRMVKANRPTMPSHCTTF